MADLDNQTEEVFQGGTTDQWRDYVDTLKVDIPEVSFKDAATFVASMTPVIGDAMAAKDVYDELQKDEPNYYLAGALGGAALVGLVPGLGDAAAKAIKKGAKEVFDVAKRVEVDPNAMGSGLGNLTLKPKQDNVIDVTSRIPKVTKPALKKIDIDTFDFDDLNLSDAEIQRYADIYKRDGNNLEEAQKRIDRIIQERIPRIEKALADALDTNKGTVSLQDYKNAVEATVTYDTIKKAARDISKQQQLLNKMGTTVAYEDAFDDAVMSTFEIFADRVTGSNTDLLEAVLNSKAERELVDYAVTENAIRNSYNKFMSTKAPSSKPATVQIDRDTDALEASRLRNDPEALEQWRTENKLPETQRQKNLPDAQAAAQALIEGSVTSKEARKRIEEAFPAPREYTAEEVMELLPTLTEVQGALGKKGTRYPILGVDGADLAEGQVVSSRLDIPAYDDYNKWVVSIHNGNQKAGTVVGYGQAIRLKNIRFGSDADTALDIARGTRTDRKTLQDAINKKTGEPDKQTKATIARIFGEYTSEDPYDLQRQAADIIASGSDEWVQVGMNPYRGSAFYDKKTGMPVFEAEEIIQVGPLVLARNVKKPTISQMKEMAVRTKDGKLRMFNEGGIAMDKQMEMAFAEGGTLDLDSVPDNTQGVDPVSGNEVPLGSMPEEVRDDIPAQLSEGEYVVPADVVRFHGVKLFEDLRTQAKMGFSAMEANGRIGGEPVPAMGMAIIEPVDDLDIMLDDSDFEVVDGYAEGGVVNAASDILSGQADGLMEYRQYRNPAGEEITIMFFNGMPMSLIPEGYVPVVTDTDLAAAEAAETGSVAASSVAQQQPVYTGEAQPMGGDNDDKTVADMPTPEAVNYKELTPDELRDMVSQARDLAPRTIPMIAGLLNPFAGLAIKAAMWHQSTQVENELKRRIKEANISDSDKTFYEDLLEVHQADKPNLADKIFKDDSEAQEVLGRDYMSPAQLAAEAVDAQVDAEAIDASVRAAFEGDMPTGMAPIADPESIEITSLNDEPGARDYKGPLAGLSPMFDTKGGVPEPYVYEPEAPAVTAPVSNNAAAFYASEDKIIAEERRDKIAEIRAKRKAELEAIAEMDAQIELLSDPARSEAALRKDRDQSQNAAQKAAIERAASIRQEASDTGRSIAEVGRSRSPSTTAPTASDRAASRAGATRGAGGQFGMNKGGLMKKKKK